MLKIQISDEAAAWYKDEMFLKEGDFVRFFARYGGCSTVQQGFSLGVSNEEPIDIGAETKKDGITFYIEEKDLWYFDENDLLIEFNSKLGEPEFHISK
ncbi:hypothetical protein BMMGA3_07625 [Bacillus methanolicus MGA3]|uniref:Core domain-containing protein n=1 Tax=Bacillus methanolicus (strain MGA3 / ATCC 53907) TaxID=796606 RepID=A0A068LQR5_BACMM|nr:hypothetical protein BMMGA3_07625 [Bacillus methanolicus MGA3]